MRNSPSRNVLPPGWNWAVCCDLDGTLSNPDHRRHFVTGDKKDWDSFARGIRHDKIVHPVACAFHLLQQRGVKGIITTARSILDHEATVDWLDRNKVQYDHLFMRGAKDFRDDWVVKWDFIKAMRTKFKLEPWIALDDRAEVVRLWRRAGVTCFQVAEGDF